MQRNEQGPFLSAVFVDYDNIYLSLKRKDEEAAKRFAKDSSLWLKEIENGRLITPTNTPTTRLERRFVMNRCYGNPVPRRNSRDNSTDMNSFPFVRHHFLRSGFEIVDCPPLTAQLKNSSDIRMVMDVRDFLNHDTYFDEFVVLSGDADFTPLLHRLRAHARRTIVYANDYTAAPYTAICDGEVREQDLIALLNEGAMPAEKAPAARQLSGEELEARKSEILAEVLDVVRKCDRPVPIETLADRAIRVLGHERTIHTDWAGHGSFRSLLIANLPEQFLLTEQAPYLVYDPSRHHVRADAAKPAADAFHAGNPPSASPRATAPVTVANQPAQAAAPRREEQAEQVRAADLQPPKRTPLVQQPASNLQSSITRIHEACQAPPLAPPEYRTLFEAMAAELSENHLSGAQTISNVMARAQDAGLDVRRDDVRFVLDVVSEADPWFEQGASANLFAGRFRNFVVARCRGQGLSLSADELDLIDAWFAGGAMPSKDQPKDQARARPAGNVVPPPSNGGSRQPFSYQQEQHADRQWGQQERAQSDRERQADRERTASGRPEPGSLQALSNDESGFNDL